MKSVTIVIKSQSADALSSDRMTQYFQPFSTTLGGVSHFDLEAILGPHVSVYYASRLVVAL